MKDKKVGPYAAYKAAPSNEREAFEMTVLSAAGEAGAGAIEHYLGTEAYENDRVQDYRLGWVWAMDWIGMPLQTHNALDPVVTHHSKPLPEPTFALHGVGEESPVAPGTKAHVTPSNERQAFEATVRSQAGQGATKHHLGTGLYANDRVQDYRTGWAWAMTWIGMPIQPHDTLDPVEASRSKVPKPSWSASPGVGKKAPAASDVEQLRQQLAIETARADAFAWGYGYLQDRMRSIDRPGWAEDCDSEIDHRIKAATAKATSVQSTDAGDPVDSNVSLPSISTTRLKIRRPA